jgi:hypothetical protein
MFKGNKKTEGCANGMKSSGVFFILSLTFLRGKTKTPGNNLPAAFTKDNMFTLSPLSADVI